MTQKSEIFKNKTKGISPRSGTIDAGTKIIHDKCYQCSIHVQETLIGNLWIGDKIY